MTSLWHKATNRCSHKPQFHNSQKSRASHTYSSTPPRWNSCNQNLTPGSTITQMGFSQLSLSRFPAPSVHSDDALLLLSLQTSVMSPQAYIIEPRCFLSVLLAACLTCERGVMTCVSERATEGHMTPGRAGYQWRGIIWRWCPDALISCRSISASGRGFRDGEGRDLREVLSCWTHLLPTTRLHAAVSSDD